MHLKLLFVYLKLAFIDSEKIFLNHKANIIRFTSKEERDLVLDAIEDDFARKDETKTLLSTKETEDLHRSKQMMNLRGENDIKYTLIFYS